MKSRFHLVLAVAISAIATPVGGADSEAPGPALHVALGKQQSIELKADAKGRLTPKAKGDAAGATITARLKQTTATPSRVKGDPTRPYLVVTNGFEKPLYFRVFEREKGSTKFVEVHNVEQPVPFGKNLIVHCWMSGSLVEEVKLSDLSFSK